MSIKTIKSEIPETPKVGMILRACGASQSQKKRRVALDGRRVGILIRNSIENAPEVALLAESEGRALAAVRGWMVVAVYRLEGVSGRQVNRHRETKRMLADLKNGYINGLVTDRFSRVSRTRSGLNRIIKLFRQRNAILISIHESLDSITPLKSLRKNAHSSAD